VLVVFPEADDRDVGELAARRFGYVCDIEQARDDGVTEFSDDLRDLLEAVGFLVGKQNS
jgi:hypothetical protein